MAELAMIGPTIHVNVPEKHMEMSPTPEPEAEYSEDTIKRWHEKFVLRSRSEEGAMILRLAFTRPRLLYQVMKQRKAIATEARRQGILAAGRRAIAVHRAARRAMGILPGPRPKAKAKAKAHAMPLLLIPAGVE